MDADIFETLKSQLITGAFPPAEKLKAEDLRKRYDCSASTIREALFRLSTLGLVEFQEQRGFRVPNRDATRRKDVTRMRILLECEGACLSIDNGDVDWESRVAAAHHRLSHIERRLSAAGEIAQMPTLWMTAELEFHQTLISNCGSDVLKKLHLMVYDQYRQQMADIDRHNSNIVLNIKQHEAILDAAIAGDKAQMRAAISTHFDRHLEG